MNKNLVYLTAAIACVIAVGFASTATAQTQQVCGLGEQPVMNNRYIVDPNPWHLPSSQKNLVCMNVGPTNHFVITHTQDFLPETPRRVSAFPNVQFGCGPSVTVKQQCTAKPGLPVKLSFLLQKRNPKVSFSTSRDVPSSDVFNTALDMRFGNQNHTTNTAELMIWLNAPHIPQNNPYVTATIDGVRYNVFSRTSDGLRYVQFRRVNPTNKVEKLPLNPFISWAMKRYPSALTPSTKFWSLQAGFELWHGGSGLTENGFQVTGMGK